MVGSRHDHDLKIILPSIIYILEHYPDISFELFGNITLPDCLKKFKDRIKLIPPIHNYSLFLEQLAKLDWDIGLCPLVSLNFNLMKSNTKWVEYTSCGIAVISSEGTVYDEVSANSCGLLVKTSNGWQDNIERLIAYPEERYNLVKNAQARLTNEYSPAQSEKQLLSFLQEIRNQWDLGYV